MYLGEVFKDKCFCCKINTITILNFHCGHIISEANGGQIVLSNLRPICSACNYGMGTKNMAVFAKHYFDRDIMKN